MRRLIFLAVALCASSFTAGATTIDFSSLSSGPTGNLTPFTTYTQSGYAVAVTAGMWDVNNSNLGDPIPSIYTDLSGGTVSVTGNSGSLFSFAGVDLGSFGNPGSFTITGYLQGSQVFQTSGMTTNDFASYGTAYSSDTLSQLTISLAQAENNVDNIVVNGVSSAPPPTVTPEPSSVALLGTGLLSLVAITHKRFA